MIGTKSPTSGTDALLALLSKPDELKKNIKDFKDAKKKADEAIAKVAKATDLDRLHAEARADRDKAQIEVAEAHAETARIIRAANEKAAEIIRQAGTTADILKSQKAEFDLECRQRSDDLDKREQAISQKEAMLRSEQTVLSEERMDLARERAVIKRKKDILAQL